MISRLWHGYTTPENADLYEAVVTKEVIPGIMAMRIPGFERIELFRRPTDREVEFITVMWFDDLDAVKRFVGEEYEIAHVPQNARDVLARFDVRSQHYEVRLTDRADRHVSEG
ncbi:antibiotic biosynthesis monooxygenase family protein [Hoeflea ulvae]|uniref:Antibiotic biosynthesis monooxygenase n=1 Tax=Hoeflea ulvae TaxID=2983764 RepID=A0ABT3YGH4_9HYPH|nr:antibiotic biosynthesis monooxygenase [Hoeflea ulvae]MCY0094996.1 antibiotic biosynthesis monooxygenase [Hoeflea ulvae]